MRLRDRKRIFDKWVRGESICDLAYRKVFDKLPSDQSVWCIEAIVRGGGGGGGGGGGSGGKPRIWESHSR